MNEKMSDLSINPSDVLLAARGFSRASFLTGAMLVPLGILSILAPMISGIMVTMMLGMILIAAGAIEMALSFRMQEKFWKRLLIFLAGLLIVLAGTSMLRTPGEGLSIITLIIAFSFIGMGITNGLLALQNRSEESWGWILFDGSISLLLGVFILAQWPVSGAWALGFLVGVRLIVHGLTLMALGTTGRQLITHLQDVRVDNLEKDLNSTIQALQLTQVILAENSMALLALDSELRKKVSSSDVDPSIKKLNLSLKEARNHMKKASDTAEKSFAESQKEAKDVFENLQKNASEITQKLKSELGMG